MADPFTDFANAIRELSSNPEYSITNFISDVALTIGLLVLFVIVGLVGARYVGAHFRYVKRTGRIGLYRIAIWDKPFLEGHVNKNDDFVAPDMLQKLKDGIPEWKIGIEDLQKYVRDGLLHFYDIKVIDDLKAKLKGGIDAIIISPVELDNPSIYYEDPEGEFAFIGSSGGFKVLLARLLLHLSHPLVLPLDNRLP